LIFQIVRKMLPKNKNRDSLLKKLIVFRENQHTMTHIFPQFRPPTIPDDMLYKTVDELVMSKDSVIVQKMGDESKKPASWANIPEEIDPSYEIPFEEREYVPANNDYNRKLKAAMDKYNK